jgi:hypothetical protein
MKNLIYRFVVLLLMVWISTSSFAVEVTQAQVENHANGNPSQIHLVISPSLPDYYFEFGFSIHDKTGMASDKPILVRKGDAPAVIQILRVSDDRPYADINGITLSADLDLDRDGYKDLYLEVGGFPLGGDYFLFNPKTGLFDFQGNFPELYLEQKTNRIYAQVHISYRIYYKVINGHLTDTMRVTISEEARDGTFEKTTEVKQHGKWKVIKREFVKNPDWDN